MASWISELEQAGVFMRGHFMLSSGKRSDTYVQCARLFSVNGKGKRVCDALWKRITEGRHEVGGQSKFNYIVSPAVGGILVGHELSRASSIPAVFLERNKARQTNDASLFLGRGFEIKKGAKVLLVDDVITTGESLDEAVEALEKLDVSVSKVACIVDRSTKDSFQAKRFKREEITSLLQVPMKIWDGPPPGHENEPPVKMGSRPIRVSGS